MSCDDKGARNTIAKQEDGPKRWAFDNFFDPICCDKSYGV